MSNSSSCGGVLLGQEGLISYLDGLGYTIRERCIWTINTNQSVTRLRFLSNGFVCNSQIQVYTPSSWKYAELNYTLTIFGDDPEGPYDIIGQPIFVTFTSCGCPGGTGFKLSYEGIMNTNYTSEITSYVHESSSDASGTVSYPKLGYPPSYEFVSMVFHPPVSGQRLIISVDQFDNGYNAMFCHPQVFLDISELDCRNTERRLRYCRVESFIDYHASICSNGQPIILTYYTGWHGSSGVGFNVTWSVK
jgi:hypothetical protein